MLEEKRVVCPKCNGEISLFTLNNPCELCDDTGTVDYPTYKAYWNEQMKESTKQNQIIPRNHER